MRSIYVHIGTRKSGTTSLQAALRASAEPLAAEGYALPLIIHDGSDRRLRRLKDLDAPGARRDVERVMRSRLRDVDAENLLISNEFLAELPQEAAEFFLDRLREEAGDARIELIITARPWSKVIGSEWQERVKGRATFTFEENLEAIRAGQDRKFTARHDLVDIVQRWGSTLGPDAISVLAVSRPTPDEPGILELYCDVVGLDPSLLVRPKVEANKSLNPAQAELLRRVNLELGDRLGGRNAYRAVIRGWLLPTGFVEGRGNRMQFSAETAEWVASQERRQVDQLRELGCRLVGDPAHLTPQPVAGEGPPVPDDKEVAEAATRVLVTLAVSLGRARARQEPWPPPTGRLPTSVRSIPMEESAADDVPPEGGTREP